MIIQVIVLATLWATVKFSGDVLQKIQEAVMTMDSDYIKIVAILLITVTCALVFKKQRKMIFGAGFYHAFAWFFDNPLWISAELAWKEKGVLGMVAIAIIINIGLLVYFRNKEAKFTLWNSLDAFAEKEGEYRESIQGWRSKKTPWRLLLIISTYVPMEIFFLLLRVVKVPFWGDFFALIALSIFEDPFIAITYIRHGDIGKLSGKIIIIFLVSIVVSIGYWVIRNGLLTELLIRPVVF